MPNLRTPSDIRALARRRFELRHREWILGRGEWPWRVSLGVPTEAETAREFEAVRNWSLQWDDPGFAVGVERVERLWPRLGAQRIPSCALFASAEEVARVAGHGGRWAQAARRARLLQNDFPSLSGKAALGRRFDALADYSDDDFARLRGLLSWARDNRKSGLYLRQLPIEGLDTKWIGSRKAVARDLLLALFDDAGLGADSDLEAVLGLRRAPYRIRTAILCPRLRRAVGGLRDIEVPVQELASLPIAPERIIIVENLETGIALPDELDCVCFMKLGLAVGSLADIPWARQARRVVYWGDIDTHGFLILDRARAALPQIASVLMDGPTLDAHSNLCVQEPSQAPRAELPNLTSAERGVLDGLRSGRWGQSTRLEQERLRWPDALRVLMQTLKT